MWEAFLDPLLLGPPLDIGPYFAPHIASNCTIGYIFSHLLKGVVRVTGGGVTGGFQGGGSGGNMGYFGTPN